MQHPTKKGQIYKSGSITFTASGFHGSDGIYYNTYDECKKKNPKDKHVLVVNEEFGGGTLIKETTLVK